MDFEKTLNEATDPIILNPKLELFKSRVRNAPLTESPKEYIAVIKKRLRCKQPRSQLLTLELIEYLTCVCNQNVHNVFHDKEFLTQINNMLNMPPSDEIRYKVLHLLQFWGDTFKNDQDLFPNFTKMYVKGVQSGIKFPPLVKSQYAHLEKIESGGGSSGYGMGQRGGIYDNYDHGQGYGGSPYSNSSKPKSPAIQKVEHDLDVFVESIQEAENRVRRGDLSRDTQELIRNLQEMGPKIQDLSIKLKTAGEYETSDKALAAGSKLLAFLENYERSQRSGSHNTGQSNGSTAFAQGQISSGGFFDDFNKIGNQGQSGGNLSFDNFNQFGQSNSQTQQPKASSGGGFFDQIGHSGSGNMGGGQQPPQSNQGSGSFFDNHFDSSQQGNGFTNQTGQNNRSSPQTFFDQHFTGGSQPKIQQQQNKLDEVNLLGIDPNTSNKGQSANQLQSPHATTHSANLDLLTLGSSNTGTPQPPQQNLNPFGGQPQGTAYGGGQFQQGGYPPQQSMATNMPPQHPGYTNQIHAPGGQTFGMQNQGINPLMYQHMIANHQPLGSATGGQAQAMGIGGSGTGNSFGVSNNIRFSSEPTQRPIEKRLDPFGDLTTDLV